MTQIYEDPDLYWDLAQAGEACQWCGYPFDVGNRILADEETEEVYCSLTCREAARRHVHGEAIS